jgi:hypothetical protein
MYIISETGYSEKSSSLIWKIWKSILENLQVYMKNLRVFIENLPGYSGKSASLC